MKSKMVCKYCGSDDVHMDAFATWDQDAAKWVLGDVYDNEWCSDCEADGHNVIREESSNEVPDAVVLGQRYKPTKGE